MKALSEKIVSALFSERGLRGLSLEEAAQEICISAHELRQAESAPLKVPLSLLYQIALFYAEHSLLNLPWEKIEEFQGLAPPHEKGRSS